MDEKNQVPYVFWGKSSLYKYDDVINKGVRSENRNCDVWIFFLFYSWFSWDRLVESARDVGAEIIGTVKKNEKF